MQFLFVKYSFMTPIFLNPNMDDILNINNELEDWEVSNSCLCLPENCPKHLCARNRNKNSISVLHVNIRSINCNFDALCVFLQRLDFQCDLIILTECWLSKIGNTLPPLDSYGSYKSDFNSQNDGVVIYIKQQLNYKIIKPHCNEANCLIVKFGLDFAVAAFYRSPSYRKSNAFIASLNNILISLKSCATIAMIGDLNINIMPENCDPNSEQYLNMCASHGLMPAHLIPTRLGNCLDHVLLKTIKKTTTIVFDSPFTDHLPVLFHIDLSPRSPPTKALTNTIERLELPKIVSEIRTLCFSNVLNCFEPNLATNMFVNTIMSIIRRHTTFAQVSCRKRIKKPWITIGLLRCMKVRDKLHIQTRIHPQNMIIQITYRRYRNFCNNLLKKLKCNYEKNQFEKAKNNPKKTWKVIKEITNMNIISPPARELLNLSHSETASIDLVNNYFANVGKDLASQIQNPQNITNAVNGNSLGSPFTWSENPLGKSMGLFSVDEQEIDDIITGLRSDCAVGWDGIPSSVIKASRCSLIPPLKHILNLCLAEGIFPEAFKKAVVHPIFKSGDRDNVTNYRPISVLTTLSKILEKILNIRLLSYLERNNLLSCNQFGFRKAISTEDAVMELTNKIVKNLDKKTKMIGIFLDLSKAFDTVSVPLLLAKMENIGVRGPALKIFQDYLSNRSQCVKIQSLKSSDIALSAFGVPQGSVLGPTLFLVYVNQLCQLIQPKCSVITYADDTALLVEGKTWEEVHANAERALKVVMYWLDSNLLTLNINKTKFLTFSPCTSSQPPSTYLIRAHRCFSSNTANCTCIPLEKVTYVKYLGVYIDQTLSWKTHIDMLTGRIRKLIFTFKKLRSSADLETLKSVYLSLAQSILTYCIPAWGGTYVTSLLKLERAQRAVLKVILKKPFFFPTVDIYSISDVLSVRQLFVLNTVLRQHTSAPYAPVELQRKRRKDRIFRVVSHRTHLAGRHFIVLGPRLYNCLSKVLEMYPLSRRECKQVIQTWLSKLTYQETEKLLESGF